MIEAIIRVGLPKDARRAGEIADIHSKVFYGFFLTFLGHGFLKRLYKGFIQHESSGLIIAEKNVEETLGFLAYSNDIVGFYKWMLKKHLVFLVWCSLLAFLRKPRVLCRLLRALAYPRECRRPEPFIALSSIGVTPEMKGHGVGGLLIARLKELTDFSKYRYIKLETDAEDNEAANAFYQKNGFVIHHPYETPQGRKMYEYRFYPMENER